MNELVHKVYDATKIFPKDQRFGITSQLQRAALSIILNYIEGYARQRSKVHINFLEISYGSLKETEYLIQFSYERKYLSQERLVNLNRRINEVARMLWKTMEGLKNVS